MAVKRNTIGAMNRYPIFYNETSVTDTAGGSSSVETERWQSWAEIQDRTGATIFTQSQEISNYDYRVRVRFDDRFSTLTGMIYEGQVCKAGSMTIESEGQKRFIVLQYSKTETWVDQS